MLVLGSSSPLGQQREGSTDKGLLVFHDAERVQSAVELLVGPVEITHQTLRPAGAAV